MHWIKIEFIRDEYLFCCELDGVQPTITGFIKHLRRHINFIVDNFGGVMIWYKKSKVVYEKKI